MKDEKSTKASLQNKDCKRQVQAALYNVVIFPTRQKQPEMNPT